MAESDYTVTPKDVVLLHKCLKSRICKRVFRVFKETNSLNISAIARKARCNNNDALRHLETMVELGVFEEKFYAGVHMFTLNRNEKAELLERAIGAVESMF